MSSTWRPAPQRLMKTGKRWQYAVARRVVQRSSALLVLESPWVTKFYLGCASGGLPTFIPREERAREGDSPYRRVLDHTSMEV